MFPIRDVNPTLIRPLVTWAIIGANVAVFFLIQPQQEPAATEFAYRNAAIACELTTGDPLEAFEANTGTCREESTEGPIFPDKNLWLSALYSMFLHGNFAHILFNMWSMWIFGNNVEEAFGHRAFLLFYLITGAAATAGFVIAEPDTTIPLVGASGAIAGVMGAYLVLFPRHLILTLIFIRAVAIPATLFLLLWFGSQFLMAGAESGIAWQAHVAGFAAGALIAFPLRERLLARIGRAPQEAHS